MNLYRILQIYNHNKTCLLQLNYVLNNVFCLNELQDFCYFTLNLALNLVNKTDLLNKLKFIGIKIKKRTLNKMYYSQPMVIKDIKSKY